MYTTGYERRKGCNIKYKWCYIFSALFAKHEQSFRIPLCRKGQTERACSYKEIISMTLGTNERFAYYEMNPRTI